MSAPEAAQQAWPWGQILATIIGSGAVAGVVNHALQRWTARADRGRAARDTALRAALILEEFSADLSAVASDWRSFDLGNAYERTRRSLPDLPDLASFDWKPVNKTLASRVLGFKGRVALSRAYVVGAFEADDELGASEMIEQSLQLGLASWGLAENLRRKYGLEAGTSTIDQYDFVAWMTAELEVREQRRAENRAVVAEMSRTSAEQAL